MSVPLFFFISLILAGCILWAFVAPTVPFSLNKLQQKKTDKETKRIIKKTKAKTKGTQILEQDESTKKTVAVLPFSLPRSLLSVGLGAITIWVTGWPAMGLIVAVTIEAGPYLSIKNTQRHKDVLAAETVQKLSDSIRSLMSSGRKIDEATRLALASPTLEFKEAAKLIEAKMNLSFAAGLDEMRRHLKHALGDMLASTLYFISASEASGKTLDAMKGITVASTDVAKMERSLLVKQQEGYSSARLTLFITVGLMVMQRIITPDGYDIYNGLTGQIILLFIGVLLASGVFFATYLAKGIKMLRLTLDTEVSEL